MNNNQNESEIGVVVNKESPPSTSLPHPADKEAEIYYVNIDRHLKFIERVFSVKEHDRQRQATTDK